MDEVDYQGVINAYNELLAGRLPAAESINTKRRRNIKRLLGELSEPTVEAARNYFGAFVTHAKPFYFGENDTGWRANFDYLLRSETLVKTREGAVMRNQLILRAVVSVPKSRWTHSSEIDFKVPRKAVTAFSPHKAPYKSVPLKP